MDIEFLTEFISAKIQTPTRYLFILDPSRLIRNLDEIVLSGQSYALVYFENDLQLRTELEWTKIDGFDLNFCIISDKNDAENRTILDFAQRATALKITPQMLLNFAGENYWSEAANWLQGEDFWRCFDSLKRAKQRANLALADPDETYLASALLGVNLTRRFDVATGFIFFFRKMNSDTFQTFRANYPQLTKFVTEKLFTEVPELRAFQDHPELLNDFWAGHYANLPARLRDSAETEDLKYQMAIKAPAFVQEQIQAFEAGYLQQTPQIQEYLNTNRVSDDWQGWLSYLNHEKILVAPIKLVLKKIVNYILRNHTTDLEALQRTIRGLEQHQALRTGDKPADPMHPLLAGHYQFVMDLVDLFLKIRKLEAYLETGAESLPEIIQIIYPQLLAPLARNLDDLETRHQHLQFVEDVVLKKLGESVAALKSQFDARFVRWIAANWQHPPESVATRLGLAPFPFQILKTNFAEKDARPVIVLLFDGLRWDGWELLQPHFDSIFPGGMTVAPMITPLPGVTRICRPYLLGGVNSGMDEWETLRRQFPGETVEIYFYEDTPASLRESRLFLNSPASIKVLLINLFDRRIHHSRLGLTLLGREVETEFRENLIPILTQLPKKSKIIITSDHGFLQVTGKWLPSLPPELPASGESQHRRFVKLPLRLADRQHFVFLENERLGEPANSASGYAFLKESRILKIQPNESYTRYAHGGISLEEMIVPLVIYN
jgi:hypothetical protein